jgi:hypothetical protein
MGKTMLALAIATLAFATLAIAAQSFSASAAGLGKLTARKDDHGFPHASWN